MNRAEWANRLAEAIRPTAVKAATAQIGQLLRHLADLPDAAFTDESVRRLAERKAGHPMNLAWLRDELSTYLRLADRPRVGRNELPQERLLREWQDRQESLRRDWDNPDGIVRLVRQCDGNELLLRTLGRAVNRWAPQHLGWMPPHIIEMLDRDPDEFRASDRMRPESSLPRHLPPEVLDQINPLPNGRKRAHAAGSPADAGHPDAPPAAAPDPPGATDINAENTAAPDP